MSLGYAEQFAQRQRTTIGISAAKDSKIRPRDVMSRELLRVLRTSVMPETRGTARASRA